MPPANKLPWAEMFTANIKDDVLVCRNGVGTWSLLLVGFSIKKVNPYLDFGRVSNLPFFEPRVSHSTEMAATLAFQRVIAGTRYHQP